MSPCADAISSSESILKVFTMSLCGRLFREREEGAQIRDESEKTVKDSVLVKHPDSE